MIKSKLRTAADAVQNASLSCGPGVRAESRRVIEPVAEVVVREQVKSEKCRQATGRRIAHGH
ncbi:hypothetical protein ACFLU1_05780 [Chloroflexota bacterium]